MRLAFAAAAILALATAACEPDRRDVQVSWTFAGQSCSAAGVATIEIDIGGEYLSPNTFDCSDTQGNLTTGVDLGRFLTGHYDIEITGFDTNNNVIYLLDDTIHVSADQDPNVFNLDVPAFSGSGGGSGTLTLFWTFGGSTCAQAGVNTVLVNIDGTPVTDDNNNPNLPCDQGGIDGVSISPIDAGTHAVTISATGSNSTAYSASLSANIAGNQETQLSPDLTAGGSINDGGSPDGGIDDGGTPDGGINDGGTPDGGLPTTGTADISWSFAGMTCAAAQVDSVTVSVDGTVAATVACDTAGSDSGEVDGIAPGSHVISIAAVRGTSGSTQLVYTTTGAGTPAQFVAGSSTHLILSAQATSPGVGGTTLTLAFPAGGPDCTVTTGSGTAVSYTLTSPAGVASAPATFTCGGTTGGTAITICNPGSPGCSSAGLTAGVWIISATATGYASTGPFSVPNDAVGTGTVTFTATGM